MEKNLKDMERKIQNKREILNRAGECYGVRSPYVLKISQELDVLLNEYSSMSMLLQKKVK